jgi:hypothetical protein
MVTLATKHWSRVSVHKVVLAFLIAERATNVAQAQRDAPDLIASLDAPKLLDMPDLSDPEQNHDRLRLLYVIRSRFAREIPPDTHWYEVSNLTDDELSELYVVAHAAWTDPVDQNELLNVAKRKNEKMSDPPANWPPIILWGHSEKGPFTIIEGNHRLVSYARSGQHDLSIPVFVGLSPTLCFWHILDNRKYIGWDMP